MRLISKLSAAVCSVALLMPVVAAAATSVVIDFAGLTGLPIPSGTPFSTYSTGSFTATANQTGWFASELFGNPASDIAFLSSTPASITVTGGEAGFAFLGLDLASAARGSSTVDYTITGLLDGSQVFTQSGVVAGDGPLPPFVGVVSEAPNAVIDSLLISLTGSGISHLDNIELSPFVSSPVPEPAVGSLFASGALVLGVMQRRRRRRLSM